MSAQPTKRQLQAQKTQDKIYNVAVSLMQKKGFDNITIEEICKKAGVSIGSICNCFKSKYDVLHAIFGEADNYFLNTVTSLLRTKDNARDKILLFFQHYGHYNTSCGVDFVKHLFNTQNKMFVVKGRSMQSVLQQVIIAGQKKKEIRADMKAEEIVRCLFIAARGVVHDWCQHDGSYNLSDYLVNYMELLLAGILTENA
jgi:AcrR family transcriptional regulator